MTDERAYARATMLWLLTTWLVFWIVERYFGETTADLIAWLPLAMSLRNAWRWWQAHQHRG
jgi:hypothetical protein